MDNKNGWADPQALLTCKQLVHGEKDEISSYNPEFAKLKQEYNKWFGWMDTLGRLTGLYDCEDLSNKRRKNKLYNWFVFLCCIWGLSGWSMALVYAIKSKEALPCIVSWYEIHGDNKPKDIFGAVGVVILCTIPLINFYFRPKEYMAASFVEWEAIHNIGYCPMKGVKSLKIMVQTVRQKVLMALGYVIVCFVGGCAIWNINLAGIIKKQGEFSCKSGFLVVLDQVLIFPIFSVAAAVVGHTSMSFALKMAYYKQCFLLMKYDIMHNDDLDCMSLVKSFKAIQHNINVTGKAYGMYIGIYTAASILASSFFVGRLARTDDLNLKDFLLRAFYQILMISPYLYTFISTASVGTTGIRVMRSLLRKGIHKHDANTLKESAFVVSYFNLRLNSDDVGLRLYGISLNFKTLTQLFSFWATFLTMIYGMAKKYR
jgi:hypothetical protein